MVKLYEQIDNIITKVPGETNLQYLELQGVLERIESTTDSGHIRSSEVFGRFQAPEVGKPFILISEAFDKSLPFHDSMRVVSTSIIKKVIWVDSENIMFWSTNSIYKLKLKPRD